MTALETITCVAIIGFLAWKIAHDCREARRHQKGRKRLEYIFRKLKDVAEVQQIHVEAMSNQLRGKDAIRDG